VKNYYELLSVDPSADANAIKTAFRREIARYHPDKVIHLGTEFQEMAATRAAELTVAYKTLTDANLRAAYDASLADGSPPPRPDTTPPDEPHAAEPVKPAAVAEEARVDEPPPPANHRGRFEHERADRDVILRRAMAARVQAVVESLYGPLQSPPVRGFDLALVPTAKPRLLGTALPRVLVKVLETVDGPALTDGWNAAARAKVHAGKSPVVVLLFGKHIAPQGELLKALQSVTRQPKVADAPHEIVVVAVDTANWNCRMPPEVSKAVRQLVDQICK
jgi:hypothetical protein